MEAGLCTVCTPAIPQKTTGVIPQSHRLYWLGVSGPHAVHAYDTRKTSSKVIAAKCYVTCALDNEFPNRSTSKNLLQA